MPFCLRCNRPLSDPESVTRQYGPKCYAVITRGWVAEARPEPATISDHELARRTRVELRRRLLEEAEIKECRDCGTPLSEADLLTCDHGPGGLPLNGYAVPQWVWFECRKCGMQFAWWKLRGPALDDLAPVEVS